jgi:type I restriction enzyme, S subunit
METVEKLITENLDIWTSTVKSKSSAGRGSRNKRKLYGAQKLRELIVELAIRGLLAPQITKDEPAENLLSSIAKERARLLKAGEIRKPKPLPPMVAEDKSFRLPIGWVWTQLGEIAEIGPRNTIDDDLEVAFVPMPLISSSYRGDHGQETRLWSEIKTGYTHFSNGDIALAKITPCFENSKAAIFQNLANGHGAGTTELHIARPYQDFIDSRFILLYLKAPMFLERGKPKMTGSAGQKRIPASFFIGNPLPLPPLAEQHRIVAKVDELMALCDQLEQEQESTLDTHDTLVTTLLGALTTATAQGSAFVEAWQRIQANFDTLFTTESSIDQLKQTILQLAVMGKLVPQDPEDEPAADLLKRISVEREKLIKTKKLKRPKAISALADDEKPTWVPPSWVTCRLNDIIQISSGDGLTAAKMVKSGNIPVFGGNGITGYHDNPNVRKETLTIGRVGYYCGAVHVTPDKAWVTDNAFITTFSEENIDLRFLEWLLKGTNLKTNENATAQPVISGRKLYPIVVSLPPLAEQRRIVTKLDKLMALCDQIKANLATAQATQLKLANSLVEQAIG